MEALRETDFRRTEAALPPPVDASANVRAALARGLPLFHPGLFPHDGTLAVCGSGPSLSSQLPAILEERGKRRPIVAVKGAHDLLVEAGLFPDVFVSVEAKPKLENVQRKNKHTLYLLSARCAPELFDWLSDCNVMVFVTYDEKTPVLPECSGLPLVGGGTTSGLRAVTIGWLLGFARFVLFGFDSCLTNMRKRFNGGQMNPEQTVDRFVYGERFICNHAMAMQADEFQQYYGVCAGISFDVRGGGLLAAIVAERRRLGYSA